MGLIKKVIHNENEKKYKEFFVNFGVSADTFNYTVGSVTYKAPVLMNFWNTICSIPVG